MPSEKIYHPPLEGAGVDFRNGLDEMIRRSNGDIQIIAHFNPDYDAVCSALAIQRIFRKRYSDSGKKVNVLIDDSHIEDFDSLYETGDIIWVQDNERKKLLEHCAKDDALVFLDSSVLKRLVRDSEASTELARRVQNIALIDHHVFLETDRFESLGFRREEAVATSELVARLFDDTDDIDKDSARLLLLGIYSDSIGYSTLNSNRFDVHYIVGNLLSRADTTEEEVTRFLNIKEDIYREFVQPMVTSQTYGSTEYGMRYTSAHHNKLIKGMAESYLMRKAYRFFLENIAGKIQGMNVMWVVYPVGDNTYHISFRSTKAYNVGELCADGNSFNKPGGGHPYSAACEHKLSDEEVVTISNLPPYEAMKFVNRIVEKKVIEYFKTHSPN